MASNSVDDADLYGGEHRHDGLEQVLIFLIADLYGADYDEPDTTEEEKPSTTSSAAVDNKKVDSGASAATTYANGKAAPHAGPPRTNSTAPPATSTQQAGNSIATYSSRDGDTSYHPYGGGQAMQQAPAQSRFGPASGGGGIPNGNVRQTVASYEGPRDEDDGSTRPSDMRDEG